MSIADRLATRAHNRLKKCAEKEAGKTRTVVEHFERHTVGETGANTVARVLLAGTAAVKQVQLFHMRHGDCRFLYVEPFDNAVQLPGEFHINLAGTFSQPAVYLKSGWQTNGDEQLRSQLEGSPGLAKAVKKLSWSKGSQVRVKLEWGLQIRGLSDGTSDLVMQAGSFGMLKESPGIAPFLEIVAAIEPLLTTPVEQNAQEFYFECYHDLFAAFVAGP